MVQEVDTGVLVQLGSNYLGRECYLKYLWVGAALLLLIIVFCEPVDYTRVNKAS